jgi:uncharacterized protein YbjT (DUF2867 family)
MAYKAVIAGASGLIGRSLLNVLLLNPEYSEILSLGRKKIQLKNKKLTQVIVDFDHLDDYADQINGYALFCCLGSTRKKTPDLNEYRKIDHDYPVKLAELAQKNGIEQYHLVSAIGANPASSNFYSKMKGETEADIKKAGVTCLHIYQPSLLTGYRNEQRPLEQVFTVVMKIIDPLLLGSLKKYRSIPANTVAIAMYKNSFITKDGVFIHPSDKIKQR